MVIHSVTPREYLMPPMEGPGPCWRPFSDGLLEGVETPQGFQVSRIISTNPVVYLDQRYAPGTLLSPPAPQQL